VSGLVDPEVAARHRAAGWWGDEVLADHIGRHARQRPDAPAYVAEAGVLTWAAYDGASDVLAAALVGAGLAVGDRAAVLMPDGPSLHVAYIANEKAGLTTVGIGSRAGEREVRHLLERTGATTLVTGPQHRGADAGELVARLRADGVVLRHHVVAPAFEVDPAAPVVVDGEPALEPAVDPGALAARRLGPDDLYLINSTSGTTGLPKCVKHTQNRWVYFHQMAVAVGELGDDEVVLAAVPAPFGFGQWTSHVTPTLLGAPCVLLERFDVDAAAEAIERHRVTVLAAVSTQFVMLLASGAADRWDLSSLRVLYTGGEAVPPAQAARFEERTGCTVLQFYGSNESGLVTATRTTDPTERRLTTAGRVLPGTEVRLLDGDRDVTSTGRGQPASRGPATSLGYLDDPEADAELFAPGGWVRHADVCTIDAEGYLTVVGRTSDLIIRGGKNISAAQVEAEVAEHPAVALAAAVAIPDPIFGERVCAFVELNEGASLDLVGLAAFLDERGVSPELKPERLEVVDALPRSSGAKVAKGELRQRAAALGQAR
jgi:acyl-CoA synthetase